MDPNNSKEWPNGFLAFIECKSEGKDDSVSAKKYSNSAGFGQANVAQLCFGDKLEDRGKEQRKVINNFLNPNWTDDFGSGGNEEGHLLMMRFHYYRNEFVPKNVRKNVQAFMTQIKKNPARVSNLYKIKGDASLEAIDEEVSRITNLEAEKFNPHWFPNQWLAFYLFGKPCHGTNHCFETLVSGKAVIVEKSGEEMAAALADLNTELASKSIRRKGKKGQGNKGDDDVIDLSNEPKQIVISHTFNRAKEKRDKSSRLEKAMSLLRSDDIHSDEETGFSKRQKLQELGMKLLNTYMNDSDEDA